MARREFQFSEGTSNKFWAVEVEGSALKVHFGRIGTAGQAQEKAFASESAAQKEADKLIAEKTRKGYVETAGGASSSAMPVAKKVDPLAAPVLATPAPPAEAAPAPPVVISEPSTTPPPLERTLQLDPADEFVVTWRRPEPLPRPTFPPFDRQQALERLRSIEGKASQAYGGLLWHHDWKKARIPRHPSRAEATFWIAAIVICSQRPFQEAVAAMADPAADRLPAVPDLLTLFKEAWIIPNLDACVAAVMTPADFLLPPKVTGVAYQDHRHDVAALFREFHLPYLSADEIAALRNALSGQLPPFVPPGYYQGWPQSYAIGAALGLHAEIAATVAAIPDRHYQPKSETWAVDYYQRPQWLVFGLPDSRSVQAEFHRLGLVLRDERHVGAWLALTQLEALDVVAAAVCDTDKKEKAAELAKVLLRVKAPEAAAAALTIRLQSKAPQVGQQWLLAYPLEAAVGLTPIAMGSGRLAEAAREELHQTRRGGQRAILEAATGYLDPAARGWLEREILASSEALLEDVPRAGLPEALGAAFGAASVKVPKTWPPWLRWGAMPPVKVGGGKLAQPELAATVALLAATALGEDPPLLAALKSHADRASLDAFAWKLFELWLSGGAPPKDRWALGAIGHLGGDASVLKLTPLVRDWPGESQHQRAVFGLECLRAVGTDTALMALNGIAQKLKFKGLKEKAQALMEEIAQARGLSRDQLADRIVPDCGLDERGSRIFDFGPRQFRFVLGSELKPLIRDAEGKIRPDLPSPTKADDKTLAEAAVADWKLLKKTLKETLKVQADRLEDAMITSRRWTSDEFHLLFVCHPLMVNLARQLVFATYGDAGHVAATFRITEDQSLADADDDVFKVPAGCHVGIVHPAHLDDAARSAWGQLLADYEIVPPFQQLGRTICRPEPADLDQKTITRFKGPKIPGIVLYGMLERSHWLRDVPADGGGFTQHSKYFPSAGLTAFIAYEPGLAIGWYEEPQQLTGVYFVPGHVKPDMWGHHENRILVRDVDPVVLSEVLRMAYAIAAKAE